MRGAGRLSRLAATPVDVARKLSRYDGRHLETDAPRWLRLFQSEGGKTLDDAVAELREAIDYCRYYAAQARQRFAEPEHAPARPARTTGLNASGAASSSASARGTFRWRSFSARSRRRSSPATASWPSPPSRRPLIAAEAVALLASLGRARVGSAAHAGRRRDRRGARRTTRASRASSSPARRRSPGTSIARSRRKTARSSPLIAETGGINAMIVDATALPEQVTDDVIASAFRSAGQRCSALRLLCLQEDVADR